MSDPPKIPKWLESLPLAPEFHPTETEFSDPIAFISRIESIASLAGICKIIPPSNSTPPTTKFPKIPLPLFTTRYQSLGGPHPQHQLLHSSHSYSLPQFLSKSNHFSKSLRFGSQPDPLTLETRFWRAAAEEKPIWVEYANDVIGSAFVPGSDRVADSEWNLQRIARASGSLTRFMPDDVPGVTSPMVYVAMLFSWFAWHVEDHELHSLNYLHFGKAKTWYAVPGDRAEEFEEVVRVKGYGGDVDRITAFGMLGEKTTLMSPEVVVGSGIPCCRLVQNPGEFVVTFPRAYHVGFSHGFNCGEAANFATPQWLKFAKEAAVRRAAMDFLPMLSHQQLLYMLTMSFVSRVPRALLSGVRSSRLENRKREEREIMVKKAFLNDMMAENNLLCALLLKYSSSGAVLWEPDLLPSPFLQSHSLLTIEKSVDQGKENKDNVKVLKAGAENLDADEEDLPVGMKIDSGALACAACGVLGYPIMAVVQLSESAQDFFHANYEWSHEKLWNSSCSALLQPRSNCMLEQGTERTDSKVTEQVNLVSSQKSSLDCGGLVSVFEGNAVDDNELLNSGVEFPNLLPGQTTIGEHGFCRPRIFCLQHALEIMEELQCKGGGDVLIICHSDYIKIKAYVTSVAEELGMKLNFKDVQLDNASPSELELINIAIGCEGHDEHAEDWTSKLGMNLRYSVKLRNQSVSEQGKMSTILGRMFHSDLPAFPVLKWQSRKARTPYKVEGVSLTKSYIGVNIENMKSVFQNTNEDSSIEVKVYHSRKRKANAMAIKYIGQLEEGIQDRRSVRDGPPIVDCKEDLTKNGDGSRPDEVPVSVDGDLHKDNSVPVNGNLDEIIDPCGSGICAPFIAAPTLQMPAIHQGTLSAVDCGAGGNIDISLKSEGPTNTVEPKPSNIDVEQEIVVVENSSENEYGSTHGSEILDEKSCETLAARREFKGTVSEPFQVEAIPEEVNNTFDDCIENSQDILMATEPALNVNLGCDSLLADQSSAPVLSYDNNSQIQLEVLGAETETRNKGSIIDQSLEHETLRKCEVQQADIPAYDNNDLGEDEESRLNSSSRADSSFQCQQEIVCAIERTAASSVSASDNIETPDGLKCKYPKSADTITYVRRRFKRKQEDEEVPEVHRRCSSFFRSPCEGLRPRSGRISLSESNLYNTEDKQATSSSTKILRKDKDNKSKSYTCNVKGCILKYRTKEEHRLHTQYRCTYRGCKKRFETHQKIMQHQRVHLDERPLVCPWDGCGKSFKWAWARTEHLRLHTGVRPYKCTTPGCELTFRFISDSSRHKRITGHVVNTTDQ